MYSRQMVLFSAMWCTAGRFWHLEIRFSPRWLRLVPTFWFCFFFFALSFNYTVFRLLNHIIIIIIIAIIIGSFKNLVRVNHFRFFRLLSVPDSRARLRPVFQFVKKKNGPRVKREKPLRSWPINLIRHHCLSSEVKKKKKREIKNKLV